MNVAISHTLPKTRLFGLHFIVDSVRLASTNLTQFALKSNAFSVTQNNDHYAIKINQGHRFLYQLKAHATAY